jgi:hypothetical protein
MSRWSDRAAARAAISPPGPRRSRRGGIVLVAAVVLGVIGAAAWFFSGGSDRLPAVAAHRPAVKAELQGASVAAGEPVLRLSAAVQRQNGIQTMPAERAPYQQQLRAYGMVLDPSALSALGNKLADAKAQSEIAAAKLAASKAAFARAQLLFRNDQNVSRAELQSAEATFRAGQAAVAAAEAQLRNLTATAVEDWGPVAGRDFAQNGPILTRLLAREAFLVQISLPPGVALADPPPAAAVELPSGARAPIRFVSPAPRVDPKLQGMTYLYMIGGQSGVLPGMELVAFLPDGHAAEGVRVPASAIVWWQGRAWAYLRTGPETFARREIPTGQPDAAGGYIVRDLPAGAEIVTSGAQSLLSEEFRAQIDVED